MIPMHFKEKSGISMNLLGFLDKSLLQLQQTFVLEVHGLNARRQTRGGFSCADVWIGDRGLGSVEALRLTEPPSETRRKSRKSIARNRSAVVMARHGIHSSIGQPGLADF